MTYPTGLYGTGEKKLLVLGPGLLMIREAITSGRVHPGPVPSLRAIGRAMAHEQGSGSFQTWKTAVQRAIHKHTSLEWLRPFVLGTRQLPANVRMLKADEIDRAVRAFRYQEHLEGREQPQSTYSLWLDRLPRAWIWYLHGLPAPAEVFIAPPWLPKLRHEVSITGICSRAGVNVKDYYEWMKHLQLKTRFEEAKTIASSKGDTPAGLAAIEEALSGLEAVTAGGMLRYALASRFRACQQAAGVGKDAYNSSIRVAKQLGAEDLVLKYLRQEPPFGTWRNTMSGLVAPNFFIPSPLMMAFRTAAEAAFTSQSVYELLALPGFKEWAEDLIFPKTKMGRTRRSDETAALADGGHKAKSVNGSEPGELVAAQELATPHGSAGGRPRRRGRQISPETDEVGQFCYGLRTCKPPLKLELIREKTRLRFGHARAPKTASQVSVIVARYARRHGLPLQ